MNRYKGNKKKVDYSLFYILGIVMHVVILLVILL